MPGCRLFTSVDRELAAIVARRSPVSVGGWNVLRIHLQNVASTDVRAYGYDPASQTIQVKFRDGSVYEYYKRPPSTWQSFQLSPSKGGFVHATLTPAGNYRKVA